MKQSVWIKAVVLCLIVAVTTVLFSITPWGSAQAQAEDHNYKDIQLFAKVLSLVQRYYVDKVNTKKLIYGAIDGMLTELDPHTNFLPPEIFKEFEHETSGQFGGLGIEMTVRGGVLTVIAPIEDTPAYKAGIKAGDKIVSIDGKSTKGMSLVDAAEAMKGPYGTKVVLGVYRHGFTVPKDFFVRRGIVRIHSVKYVDMGDGYAYIRLTSFIENSARDMRRALLAHIARHHGIKGLILDLRGNPGGLLSQAVAISNLFIKKGVIVSTIGRNRAKKDVMYANPKDALPEKFPMIVLINGSTASAAEITAGALQDHHRALIMGQRSFGKGSVQTVVKLGGGAGLKLTVARYYTPNGHSIQDEGIMPDVIVPDLNTKVLRKAISKIPVEREADMEGHLLNQDKTHPFILMHLFWDENNSQKMNHSPLAKMLRNDFQLLQAYNYLRSWHVIKSF